MSLDIHNHAFSWKDFEAIASACTLLISVLCLILIYVTVNRQCSEIFLSGDDCGVGIGWFGLAAGFIGVIVFSVRTLYRLRAKRS